MIVDREEEIRQFKPREFWTIDAKMLAKGSRKAFAAKFYGNPKKLEIKNGEQAKEILAALEGRDYVVEKVKKGIRKKNPAPPFTTSTLQQEAARKLNFQARRTMKAAQELYEGITLPKLGAVGLITYMRTDSLRVSDEAYGEANTYIKEKYGDTYLPPSRRTYKSKANAQDGHEAIRPTMPGLHPDEVKESLTSDQYRLYRLIWMRFIASQMATALYDTMSVDIAAGEYKFKASGFTVKFDGFTVLYEEGKDEEEESASVLPPLKEGDELTVQSMEPTQHFTQPPPRYTEASLIKTLEENGIGRPSTYAPTISIITSRGYVEREQKTLVPTVLGEVITQLMKDQFTNIVDAEFTANMEKSLDLVEDGKVDWRNTLGDFYGGFGKMLEDAEKAMEGKHIKIPDEETDEVCDVCGKPMVIKVGRFGKFMACSGYPECTSTKKIVTATGGICPECGGRILIKKSKKGRSFYGCENYPTCNFATWEQPLRDVCPKCGKTLFKKAGKNGAIHCIDENCGYSKE